MRLKSVTTLAATAALLTMAAGVPVAADTHGPVLIPGHQAGDARFECDALAAYFDRYDDEDNLIPFEYAYKIDGPESLEYTADFDDGHSNTINLTVYGEDDSTFDFSATNSIGGVVVKGGSGANYYYYHPQVFNDSGLVTPTNLANNKPFAISHISFCWDEDPDLDECWEGETAWSAGYRYNTERGNWATYTQLSEALALEDGVDIFAGRTIYVGKAKFALTADPELVTITITLEGARFALDEDGNPVEENLKIQGYDAAPSGNPSPGGFAFKSTETGTSAEVTVGAYAFYGVHLDVEVVVDCPVEEEVPAEVVIVDEAP